MTGSERRDLIRRIDVARRAKLSHVRRHPSYGAPRPRSWPKLIVIARNGQIEASR